MFLLQLLSPFARCDKAHGAYTYQTADAQTGNKTYPKHMLTSPHKLPPLSDNAYNIFYTEIFN